MGWDFRGDGASVTKVMVASRAVQNDSKPAANINPE
jgi:hypothetical protein